MINSTHELQTLTEAQPKRRINRSPTQWKSLVEEYSSSGLTKTAFCKKHGIATSGLYRWLKEFKDLSASTDFIDITAPVSDASLTPSSRARDDSWQVELELGDGIVLRVRTR